jgi:hypothetical protein
MKRNPVSLDIGSVSLEGFAVSPRQAGQVRTGMERELSRLISENGLPAAAAQTHVARAPLLPASAGSTPDELGRQIAQSVYATLKGRV